ncbi:hypothetical protein [Novosphingobium sp.]|uniref:hypothetical protein n=1 Tax=Novosphingobium sp. TaxID=1874826 RepID=UPI003BAB5089
MSEATKQKAESAALKAAREALEPFLKANECSSVIEVNRSSEVHLFIDRPWNDASLALMIPKDEPADFYSALNQIILPERFTAIYHIDKKSLEVIWTAYKLPDSQNDIIGRRFTFKYLGANYKCHFSKSSERLLSIAKNFLPLKMSSTSFRNLQSFDRHYKATRPGGKPDQSLGDPVSFWIDGLDFHPELTVEFVNNLNFYLSYYDKSGPIVVLHPAESENKPMPRLRYISGKFPSLINGKKLDNNLLSFWEAPNFGDPARRFQYYYRIMEYASFFYLESSTRLAVKRILNSPHAIDDISETTDKLMSAFSMSKLDEYARFAQLIQDTIDPNLLWSEIKENLPAFSKDFKCDGGFVIKALVSATAKQSTFAPKGVELFTKAIRDIRNALSHGRDFRSATVITPTSRNLKALQPWVHLIAVAAGQVVLLKDIA